ncbi:MAG: hypothetical protein OEY94_05160 [Alphaproteobacteria bacterium]|nr:hypothetical protein [Alphaproteobacteria bacterium]
MFLHHTCNDSVNILQSGLSKVFVYKLYGVNMSLVGLWNKVSNYWNMGTNYNAVFRFRDKLEETYPDGDKPLSSDDFMSAIIEVTENAETKRLFDIFAEDEGEDTPEHFRVVSEFGEFLREMVRFRMPRERESAVKLAEHIQSNLITRKYAEKYSIGMWFALNDMLDRVKDGDRLSILSALEKDGTFLPNVIRNTPGPLAASFFVKIRQGMDDKSAVELFRQSPSFQAGAEEDKFFVSYLKLSNRVLLSAILSKSPDLGNTLDLTKG